MSKQPSLFVSHGSPMIMVQQSASQAFLKSLGEKLPRPRAIISATAHWTTAHPMINADTNPQTVHDFHGFPQELYMLSYPAPSEPKLAQDMLRAFAKNGIEAQITTDRGRDHGTWVPLKLAYPNADIPVVELSVQPRKSARWHYELGKALAPLREDGVMIMGSGGFTHNLQAAERKLDAEPLDWVVAFADWARDQIKTGNWDALMEWETGAPYAQENHPTPEHFLPLFVALGAGGDEPGSEHLFGAIENAAFGMDAFSFT
ncbi:MAG: dioxygenase [Magnetovibrio sp.]|nr:dioxygenase [Magnetovibrio sp.]